MAIIPAVCLMIAGVVGALGIDNRIAWGGVAVAGLLILVL